MVAERLFNLLPPRMPLADKYRLTETLWKLHGPSSRKIMRVGPGVAPDAVVSAFRGYFTEAMTSFKLSPQLERRFAWLAGDDVATKQALLNKLVEAEKLLAAESIRLQTPVLIEHLASDTQGLNSRVAQIVTIGKHELEIILDRRAEGVALEDPPVPTRLRTTNTGGQSFGCLAVIIIALLIMYFLSHR